MIFPLMASDAEPQRDDAVEKVGLLFVHGIGEQKRWEHLRSTVVELSELLRMHGGLGASVSVVDRTDGWKVPPGEPITTSEAPITVSLRQREIGAQAIDFECHEVWWSDLGIRLSLFESIRFWIWGLGQWAAPVYIEMDASGLTTEVAADTRGGRTPYRRPKVQLPTSVAVQLGYQMLARFNLAWAGLVAVLTVLSLSLFKRIAGSVGQVDTAPSLLVQYIGDVQVYEQRARPGKGPVSDPGHPKRVGIRRRMVSEMVAMGAREYDRWYILAHSLGTVVAFNGIGEIGHALPNYLPEQLWKALPDHLRTDHDADVARREDIENMMPARPAWLAEEAGINRPALFSRLRGFVTYGSPLDKFAALWPRIVAFETDYGPDPVFPKCAWVNIVTNTDPVAGAIDRYGAATADDEGAGKDLPRLHNVKRPEFQPIGLSHILYWQVTERWNTGASAHYQSFFKWLTGGGKSTTEPSFSLQIETEKPPFGTAFKPGLADHASPAGHAAALTAVLWAATTVIIGTVLAQFAPDDWELLANDAAGLSGYAGFYLRLMPAVAAAASLIIYLAGHVRWLRETWFNHRLAEHDRSKLAERDKEERQKLDAFIRLAAMQIGAGVVSLLTGATTIALVWTEYAGNPFDLCKTGLIYAVLMLVLIILAAFLQSAVNKLFGKGGKLRPTKGGTK